MATTHDTLAERYGAPSPRRRRALVAGSVLLALAFLGWLLWAAVVHADPQVTSELVRFDVDGEHSATAEVDVRLDEEIDDLVATCTLRAYADDHVVVGELTFDVDGAEVTDGSRLERVVRTDRRATSVELMGCTTPEQSRPR